MEHFYEIFDWTLLSNIAIPELNANLSSAGRQQISFVLEPAKGLIADADWTPLWRDKNDEVWLMVDIRSKERYALRFPDFAEFSIRVDEKPEPNVEINCVAVGETPPETIRHLLLDQVIPLVFSCLGRMVMHMAVVKIRETGIAFLGASGQGKSTLTAEFSRNGFEAVSDDTVLISEVAGKYFATPNYSGLRLWSDSQEKLLNEAEYSSAAHYNDKRRVTTDDLHFTLERVPLTAFYVLENSESDIGISRLGFGDAVKRLIESKYRLLTDDRAFLANEFDSLSDVLASVPCFQIGYPRDYERIGEVREALVDHLLELENST